MLQPSAKICLPFLPKFAAIGHHILAGSCDSKTSTFFSRWLKFGLKKSASLNSSQLSKKGSNERKVSATMKDRPTPLVVVLDPIVFWVSTWTSAIFYEFIKLFTQLVFINGLLCARQWCYMQGL